MFSCKTHAVRPAKLRTRTRHCHVGSLGQPRDRDSRASYVLVHGKVLHFYRVDYDIDTSVAKLTNHPDIDDLQRGRLPKEKQAICGNSAVSRVPFLHVVPHSAAQAIPALVGNTLSRSNSPAFVAAPLHLTRFRQERHAGHCQAHPSDGNHDRRNGR